MSWGVYGANGYTGRLVTALAVQRGERPVLLGRSRQALQALAGADGLEVRVVSLDDPAALREALQGLDAVAHCAGPFRRTSEAMVDACLATGTHYADVTGEVDVLEAVLDRHAEAVAAGVSLLPGSGFDVVPTDCLAGLVAGVLPDADELHIGFVAGGGLSRGTAVTSVAGLADGGRARRRGQLVSIRPGSPRRAFDLPSGARTLTAIPWGDLSTAYRSTGIPDITTYTQVPGASVQPLLAPLMRLPGARRVAEALVSRVVSGPDEERRGRSRSEVVVVARRGDAEVEAALTAPNPYALTADSVVRVVLRQVGGQVTPGAWTPAQAHGPRFVAELDDVLLVREPVR